MVAFSFIPAITGILGALYLSNFLAVIIYGIKATKNDPTDPTIYK